MRSSKYEGSTLDFASLKLGEFKLPEVAETQAVLNSEYEGSTLDFASLKLGDRLNLPEVAQLLSVAETQAVLNSEFEILEIHCGGMAMCLRLKSLDNSQTYALKRIRPDLLGNENVWRRFHDELEVWRFVHLCNAVVENIGIVRINDIPGVLAPWMDGGNLAHMLPQLTPAQKFETIVRVVRALKWVHEKLGVIHRDLKPANILFDREDSELRAYVSDWGLARPLHKAPASASDKAGFDDINQPDRTQWGMFLGTVDYAAPEQIENSATVDHRADMYALGCIMYELETGVPPFTGSSVQEIARQHLHVSPAKLGEGPGQTTLGLEHVIDRCLAKDSGARYATYEELERDLLAVAKVRSFPLNRCVVSERDMQKEYRVFKKARSLAALGQFEEAADLLRPYYDPALIKDSTVWDYCHKIALGYATCLVHISGGFDEIRDIYKILNRLKEKPVEFYVNYAATWFYVGKWVDVKKICECGLTHFPADFELLFNYTSSLRYCGEIEKAHKLAMYYLRLRRDVYSITAIVEVLTEQRNRLRNCDLPKAISLAKEQYNFIKEGLTLNPRFPHLRLAKIRLLRFAGAPNEALNNAFETMIDDKLIPYGCWELAFLEMIEELGENQNFDIALTRINEFDNSLSGTAPERLLFIKWKICVDRYMRRQHPLPREVIQRFPVIQAVIDYFLRKKDGKYPYPVTTARVLAWMGDVDEAEALLRNVISGFEGWNVEREFVRRFESGDRINSEDLWNARRELAFLLQEEDRFEEAISEANRLVEEAPWRYKRL